MQAFVAVWKFSSYIHMSEYVQLKMHFSVCGVSSSQEHVRVDCLSLSKHGDALVNICRYTYHCFWSFLRIEFANAIDKSNNCFWDILSCIYLQKNFYIKHSMIYAKIKMCNVKENFKNYCIKFSCILNTCNSAPSLLTHKPSAYLKHKYKIC